MAKYDKLVCAGIDMNSFLNRLMGNEALIPLFARRFAADPTYSQLTAACAARDAAAAERASHTLKGMCGNLSLSPLFEYFSRQVALLRAGEHAAAFDMMEHIAPAFETAIRCMNEWLAEDAR